MGKILEIFQKVFNYILDLASNDIGIDLGTATTLVYVKGEGVVLCEPSVVAVERGTSHVLAVGEEAKRMLGRTPGNIVAIRPMRDGVITNFEVTEAMLRHFIRKVRHRRFQIRPRIVIAIPSGITEVERRAVKESAERAGARDVFLIEEPVAAAIGVGLPIQEPVGNMIIDVGGGTTEIAVISLAGIVFSKSIRIGGDEMNDAIVEYLKKTYNLMVGERTSEDIKIKIGSAYPLEEEMSLEVKGRDLIAGLPKTVTVTSEEIRESLQEPLRAILEVVKISLERTPPELAADLIEHGIVMAGGGSLLKGLDKLISEETGLPVHIADDPVTAVANGTGKVLNEIKYLKKVTVSIKPELNT
ncbi:MAG: rod shape-determining protein [Candidatus Omnitrophota bacterium]|jgi:rod shape-determining protein MreB|nr:rod shape-determining protein [Candidatus Omnitrophota bacterium]MDD5519046.1 rod shape-determining protein [Candidatus Omnitrophota bacterium]